MTLVEMMVVLGIVATLLGIGVLIFKPLKANYDLSSTTNQLYTELEWVREHSMGRAHLFGIQFRPWVDDFGVVHNTPDGYTVFEDRNNNAVFDPGLPPPNKEEIITVDLRRKNITLAGFPPTLWYTRKSTPRTLCTITLTSPYSNPVLNVNTKRISISMFKIRIN
jgi:type II secretory pathway pseudopilin PulG